MATVDRPKAGRKTQKVSSEILDRLPPQSLEAERGVLGSLLLDPQRCDDVILVVRPDDFYSDAHRRIYQHVVELHEAGKRVDLMLLVEQLRSSGELDDVGGVAYIAELAEAAPTAANAAHYASIVRAKATLRALIHAGTDIIRDAYDTSTPPRELLNRAEQTIFAIHDQREQGQLTAMHDVLLEAFEQIDARVEKGAASGVPTGFADLDELTGGLHDSELTILAARPSMGKTALATNIAEYVASRQGVTTLFISLEMSRLELAQRMLCARARINGHKLRGGFLSASDRNQLVEKASELSQAPLFIDDTPSRTITEIAASARRLKRRNKLGLIIIDYLQLVEPDNSRDPRQEQVAKIARRLKAMARELTIPVMCLAQLNRQADAAGNGRPRLSHLRESGAIEQDADVVMFVHREDYQNPDASETEQNIAHIIVAKQRNGPIGDIELLWHKNHTRFENVKPEVYDFDQRF